MKDSKKYSQKVGKLFRSLKQKYPKVEKTTYDDPVDAIVYAVISEHMPVSAVGRIIKRIEKHFVDLNDLRVSRAEEIIEVMGISAGESKKTVSVLTKVLNAIFDKFDMDSLVDLKDIGKRQAKKKLEQIDVLSRFAINYCFLTSLGGHAIPLTEKMVNYLKVCELVHPEATDDDIEGFLERQITSAKAYGFYSLLRQESENSNIKVKKTNKTSTKKAVTKKKTKKTAQKTSRTKRKS